MRVIAALSSALLLAVLAVPAVADHPAPALGVVNAPLGSTANSGGGEWELVTTLLTGNPHTDLDFFTQGGDLYVSAGTLAMGLNAGGQTIFRLTRDGEVDPDVVAFHPSAGCLSIATGITGLQHDVEATPKGEVLLNTDWGDLADRRDAQLLIDATDAPGRCHDNANVGEGAPRGGLEIIDITDITNPVEIGLTTHIGQAHTVNVDPKRPHIAYAVSSDSVGITTDSSDWDGDGDTTEEIRTNENPSGGLALDGFEVVDLSSCMDFPPGTSVEAKRDACRPQVYRFRFEMEWTRGTFDGGALGGCHELELYPDDTLVCAGLNGTLLLDMSGAFDDMGTPDDYTDDRPRGTPLPCRVRDSTSLLTPTGAKVTDCVIGEGDQSLAIPNWLDMGAPSLEGVELIGFVNHAGSGDVSPEEDIEIAHEAELTHSGRFVIVSDERGGGVVPPGASCPTPGVQPADGNGGLHAFRVDALFTSYPGDPRTEDPATIAERAYAAYARTPDGDKAVIRATPRVPAPTFCTAHVFQQIPGQNRIFAGWYTQGTQVFDYIEHPDGSFEWREVAYFVPENANTWTSAVFKVEENPDGTFTYWGATGDFQLANVGPGRNAVDIYRVTLPPPPQPLVEQPPAPPPAAPPPPPPPPLPAPLPTTGGGVALAAAAVLAAGLVANRRRR